MVGFGLHERAHALDAAQVNIEAAGQPDA